MALDKDYVTPGVVGNEPPFGGRFERLLGWSLLPMTFMVAWLGLWDDTPNSTLFRGAKYLITWCFDISGTILGVYLVCWIGMWIGLRAKSRLSIAGWAAALSTGIPALFRLLFEITLDPMLSQSLPQSWGVISMWFEQLLILIYFAIACRRIKRLVLHSLSSSALISSRRQKLNTEC